MNNGRSNERVPSYMLDNFEVNYPYGGYGGIPVVPSSRNQKGSNIRSHNYEHIRWLIKLIKLIYVCLIAKQ